MINQRIFLNVLDGEQRPIFGCRVKIENRTDKFEADTDYSGIVEFLVPLGVYALTLEHPNFKKKVYRMALRDGFSFTRIILQQNSYSIRRDEVKKGEHRINLDENLNKNINFNVNNDSSEGENIINNKLGGLDFIKEKLQEEKANQKAPLQYEYSGVKNENIDKKFMKTEILDGNGIWGAMGGFDGVDSIAFEDILNGAKAMLQEIMEFAGNIEFNNEEYKEQANSYNSEECDEFNIEIEENNKEKTKDINNKTLKNNYDDETYDIYEYEEEFYEPMSGSQGQ